MKPLRISLSIFIFMILSLTHGMAAESQGKGQSKSVEGKSFLVAGISIQGENIAAFSDVFIFEEDGNFIMSKLKGEGKGEYYELSKNLIYCIFTTSGGADIDYFESLIIKGSGEKLPKDILFGIGRFLIVGQYFPVIYVGLEVS